MNRAILLGRVGDIEAMAGYLRTQGFKDEEMTLLPDPTAEQLSTSMKEAALARPGDKVVIHYCGAGCQVAEPARRVNKIKVSVTGAAGSGKTTICRLLSEALTKADIMHQVDDDAFGVCRDKPLDRCLEGLRRVGTIVEISASVKPK
jgi:hypothetical protein